MTTDSPPGGTEAPARPKPAAVGAAIGTSVEFYDFTVYGTASALVFGKVFFPEISPVAGTLAALATYSVAFFTRPLGGLLFGYLGDRFGRKRNLLITIVTMGVATFLVGCIPSYASIGVGAPILLILLRVFQGIAVGGEWGGAALMAVEHAPEGRKGFFGSFVQVGSPAGSLLATLTFYLLTSFGDGSLTGFAWRIPFLASAILLTIGLYIRLRLPESPDFSRAKQAGQLSSRPMAEVWNSHRRSLGIAIGAAVLPTGGFYFVAVYLLLVYAPSVGVSNSTALLAGVFLNVATLLTINAYGWLGDRFGAKKISVIGCLYMLVMVVPMFAMVSSNVTALVLLSGVICYAGANAVFALSASLISSVFPTHVRNTGTSVAYQVGAMVSAAPAPFLATWLRSVFGGATWPVILYLALLTTITLVCVVRLPSAQTRASMQDIFVEGRTNR